MKENKIVIGDVHGLDVLYRLIRDNNISDMSIVQVGDFGLGFKSLKSDFYWLDLLDKLLEKRNSDFYVIRGNHDSPVFWTKQLYQSKNIRLVKDYEVIDNILFIGGAISIDRCTRRKNISWWENEGLVYKSCVDLKDIKYIISHTAPDFTEPLLFSPIVEKFHDIDFVFNKKDLKSELISERKISTTVYKELCINNKIDKWFYGHFHFSNTSIINDTMFCLLDIDEMKSL